MVETIQQFLSPASFMPHGHCYLWTPGLVWLQVVSNSLIGLSYVAISLTLAILVKRGEYVPFKGMALAFGLFIITCGLTHFFDVLVIWEPAYWLDGGVRAVTALASVTTAIMLPPLVPRAVSLARGARAVHERGIKLEAAVSELEHMYAKIKQLDKLKTEFFANVSHELRTPLALILGPIETLKEAPNLSREQRRDVDVVRRNARILLSHVEDLLDVAKLENGRLKAIYAAADLAELVRSASAHFEALAREKNVRLIVEAPATLRVELDPNQIYRVILNLLSNAFKFTGEGGLVRCSLRIENERAILEVADTGPGIAEEHREAVFQRFSQVEGHSRGRAEGTGLGLAIVKDFAGLHRGDVTVAAAPEGGALLSVSLPLRAPESENVLSERAHDRELSMSLGERALLGLRTRSPGISTEGNDSKEARERPSVLVVEDNLDMSRFIAQALTDRYRVETAPTGAVGLAKALLDEPDLIISDIMMPEMSGDELVRRVREHRELAHVPILLLTARTSDELRAGLLEEGAQDYLSKPFSVGELRARAANLIKFKRTHDVLQSGLEEKSEDLERLASLVSEKQQQLAQAAEAAESAREEAERANQLKTTFLRMVSHELRAPLANLLMQLERLKIESRELSIAEELSSLAERMNASGVRMQDLIEALLQYARLESGVEVQHADIDAASLARRVVSQFQPRAEAKGLELALEVSPEIPPLRSDPKLVRVVLASLLSNAIKFTDSGKVTLRVGSTDGACRFSVIDTGPGIAPHEHERMFEPFEHGSEVRKKHLSGMGLGLALVKQIVTKLGGGIEVNSSPGEGSTFAVVLRDETSAFNSGGVLA